MSVAVAQLVASTNKRIVGGLASLDTKLEEVGVLPKLEAPKHPDDITDDNGDLTEDVNDVRYSAPWKHTSCLARRPHHPQNLKHHPCGRHNCLPLSGERWQGMPGMAILYVHTPQ